MQLLIVNSDIVSLLYTHYSRPILSRGYSSLLPLLLVISLDLYIKNVVLTLSAAADNVGSRLPGATLEICTRYVSPFHGCGGVGVGITSVVRLQTRFYVLRQAGEHQNDRCGVAIVYMDRPSTTKAKKIIGIL